MTDDKNRDRTDAGPHEFSAIVRQCIHHWDPYSLLRGGAPGDEFDDEIRALVAGRAQLTSIEATVQLISKVFCDAFGAGTFPPARCVGVATHLHEALRDAGLL